jgi:stress response protein YsnF
MPLAVDLQGGVSSAWSNVITFVPKLAVTEEHQVAEEVRKEQVEVDDQDQLRRQDRL